MKKINLNLDEDSLSNYYDHEHSLNIRYITDIDSIANMHAPPKFNPDTRTYFKCSIYSPSNRLYTVNEEINSTT